jgi:hypothetical protein
MPAIYFFGGDLRIGGNQTNFLVGEETITNRPSFSRRDRSRRPSKAAMQIFAVVEAERWLRARDSGSPYGFIFGGVLLVQISVPKMFEPKGDENIGSGYTRHQNAIAALSCSRLLTF